VGNVKILFKLENNEDNYPPFSEEIVWAFEVDKAKGLYRIDNTPFYIYGISFGDTIKAVMQSKQLYFKEIIEKSGNSTIRIYCKDIIATNKIQEKIKKLGASFEGSNIASLFAVNIPKNIDFNSIISYLEKNKTKYDMEYEDGDIQHKI